MYIIIRKSGEQMKDYSSYFKGPSLNEAKKNYKIYGACKKEYVDKKLVRKPFKNELPEFFE